MNPSPDSLRLHQAHRLPALRLRSVLYAVAGLVAVAGILITVVKVDQSGKVSRIEHANLELLVLAAVLEALSFAGYVVLTRAAFRVAAPRIGWRASTEITLAGVVATRALATGGAGGAALTAWALRAAGMAARTAGRQLTGFLVALYSVFFVGLLLLGVGLAAHVLPGSAPRGLAVLGALVAAGVIAVAVSLFVAPADIERRARRAARGDGRVARLARRLAAVPAVGHEGTKAALGIMRGNWSAPAAAVAWWAFDIAVLAVSFVTFGSAPGLSVIVFCYLLGHVANVIPVPGGVGPVEGGMIACFAASGVPLALAVVAVLSYTAISTWLPVLPGVYGFWRLRRTAAGWRPSDPAALA